MTEIIKSKLWMPGQGHELNQEYPVPSNEELQQYWSEYIRDGGEVVSAPGVYGVLRMPKSRPTAYASIDLCEVLRDTRGAIRAVEEVPAVPPESIHLYGDGLSIADDVTPVAQVLIAHKLIPPIEGVSEIAALVQSWRKAGVYVFANTSTLPGCEPGTIAFLQDYLPDSFDGIVFPRNHDGSLPLTKGVAARNVLQFFGEESDSTETIALHIDDASHHNAGFREALGALPNIRLATFQPEYPSHLPLDAGSIQGTNPLESFEQASLFLAEQLL